MGRRLAIVAAAAALLLAGCVMPADDGVTSQSMVGEEGGDAPPALRTWYLADGHGLTTDAPTASTPERVTLGSFYDRWALGEEQPTWRGAVLDEPVHLTGNATLTFWVEARTVVATTGPRDEGFPEFVVYLGSEGAVPASASVYGPDVYTVGAPVKLEATLPLPEGGLVLEAGTRPVVLIAPVMTQQERGLELDVLQGSTGHPSRLEVTAATYDPPPSIRAGETHFVSELAGSAYALDGAPATEEHPLHISRNVTRLEVTLETSGVGVRDADLALLGPDGSIVASAATPHPHEGILLHAPAIEAAGPGEWTIRVANYGHAVMAYEVMVTLDET